MQQVSVCFGIRLVCFETRPISCRDRDFSRHFQTKKKMIFFLQGLRKSLARFRVAHRQIVAKWGIGTHAKHVADSSEPKSTAPCIVVHPYLIVVNRLLLVCILHETTPCDVSRNWVDFLPTASVKKL